MRKRERPVRLDAIRGMDHGIDGAPGQSWKGPQDPRILEVTVWLAEEWIGARQIDSKERA